MRKNFGSKPWTYPQPVFIVAAYDSDGKVQLMNAAWGGIDNNDRINLCLSKEHMTVKSLLQSQAFTVSIGTKSQIVACDYVGVVSGSKEPEKFKKTGWHQEKSIYVNAPVISELPMTLECTLVSYDEFTGHLVGEIHNVSADESILNDKGKIDPAKLQPVTFDPVHNDYLVVGEKVGNAFRDGLTIK